MISTQIPPCTGFPVTDSDVLAHARAIARDLERRGHPIRVPSENIELPAVDARFVQSAHRMPPRMLMRARLRANMEGREVTDVIVAALTAYAAGPVGDATTFER
ncbi:hypothetical protein [Cellulomonas sp. KRMCY2]|uniref:hypothetical protein n=1 Tax=Cellulomonas sp. KRMCY2 TaxID=1304865 RepID=UPI00045E7BE3|nr:hypothetical protein [Cellulomonas sp. KRMCY2]